MSSRGLPALSGEAGLSRYLTEIRKFPLLTPEDEYMFAKRWKEHEAPEAARRLVTSLRAASLSPCSFRRLANIYSSSGVKSGNLRISLR